MANEDSWQLRSVGDKHTCNSAFDIRVMKFKPRFSRERAKAFRAKQIALVDINGTFAKQYKRLYDYGNELMQTNLGSTVKLQVQRSSDLQQHKLSASIIQRT
ncbi:hypothetical protein PIB30_041808 [Stylosanthes scabra]|uniref:Uncharacterized protein n=1 Tax=Stylosanthes scabra TaxID=79078 RepID=A0ABU6ZDU2_9FABA|nr:hypothetical protein [Stylosanthes scabra]